MKIYYVPPAPEEFDYDLWISDDGRKMVRIISTDEVTDVSDEVFRYLRSIEKSMRRYFIKVMIDDGKGNKVTRLLSLDYYMEDEYADCIHAWLKSPFNTESYVIEKISMEESIKMLPEKQREAFLMCDIYGYEHQEYAQIKGISKQSAHELSKKAKLKFTKNS